MQLIRPANLLLSRLYNSSAIAHAEDEAKASYVDAPRPNMNGTVGSRMTATCVMPGVISLSSSSHFVLVPYS